LYSYEHPFVTVIKFCIDGSCNNMYISSALYTLVVFSCVIAFCWFVDRCFHELTVCSVRSMWRMVNEGYICGVMWSTAPLFVWRDWTELWKSLVRLADVGAKIYLGTSSIWGQKTALFMNLKNGAISYSPVYNMWLFSIKICWHVHDFMLCLLSV